MDKLGSHKGNRIQRAIHTAGARLLFLPPYSSDFNPSRAPGSAGPQFLAARARYALLRRAVTSISIFMRGSNSPASSIVAAGRTSPKYSFNTGQHASKSARLGRM
jgi:hypothetical protein